LQFALSVAVACGIFLLIGSALLRPFHARPATALPFTSIYFAQMLLWFSSYLFLPAVNATLIPIIGTSGSIRTFVIVIAVAVFLNKSLRSADKNRTTTNNGFHFGHLITIAGTAAILKVALAYSSQSHIGALGLDTHQHLYWIRQILDAQYVPLAERGTEVLSLYPKAFHLLTAIWTTTSLMDQPGSWLKLMPFLQAFLPCIAVAELVLARAARDNSSDAMRPLLAVGFASALLLLAFAMSRMVYPNYDLGGTPRFASSGALFFPYVLFLAGSIFEHRLLRRLGWILLPATGVLLLAMNAILVVQLIVFVIPLMLVSQQWMPTEGFDAAGGVRRWIYACIALVPFAIAASDPWIVAQWTQPLGSTGDAWLNLFGVLSPERAAALGLIATDELVTETTDAVVHSGVLGIAKLFVTSTLAGIVGLFGTGWRFPFLTDLMTDTGRVAVRVVFIGCAAGAIYWTRRQRTDIAKRDIGFASRLTAALTAGSVIGGAAQIATFEFANGLSIGRSYTFELLRNYCEIAPSHVGLIAGGFALIAVIYWASDSAPPMPGLSKVLVHPASIVILLALTATAPFTLYGTTDVVEPDKSFWAPVTDKDLLSLRKIESHISDEDRVMAPANTWGIGVENWIIPQGPTAGVLPFTTKQFVFNSRLGTSVFFNWKDLANFCRGTKEHRAKFLSRNNVRWFLLKGVGSNQEAAYRTVKMCKLSLPAIGVTFPAAFTAGELALYPIDPRAVKASFRERNQTAPGS
jgi:hypothetical protein